MEKIKNRIKSRIRAKMQAKDSEGYMYSSIDIKDLPKNIIRAISKSYFDIKSAKKQINGKYEDDIILTLEYSDGYMDECEYFDVAINVEIETVYLINCSDYMYRQLATRYFSDLLG
jgi:hypothetical protein